MTQAIKFTKAIAISIVLISIPIVIKFKPAYAVVIDDEIVGYIQNKNEFQEKVNEEILTTNDEKVAFVALDNVKYEAELITRNLVNEEEAIDSLKENSKNIYKVYEIKESDDSEDAIYVNTMEEAEEIVNTLKQQYEKIEPDIKITQIYLEEEPTEETIKLAKEKIEEELNEKLEEQIKNERTLNGIYLACAPLNSGYISSRFGARESIRNHVHKGIDIAASYGTSIKAVADGTVKSAGYNDGGYGNLVVIDHGNGVTTYYGNCSAIYVTAGQKVSAGDIVAAVGSTGNSTGNHLHFEVRLNDQQINPETYVK